MWLGIHNPLPLFKLAPLAQILIYKLKTNLRGWGWVVQLQYSNQGDYCCVKYIYRTYRHDSKIRMKRSRSHMGSCTKLAGAHDKQRILFSLLSVIIVACVICEHLTFTMLHNNGQSVERSCLSIFVLHTACLYIHALYIRTKAWKFTETLRPIYSCL